MKTHMAHEEMLYDGSQLSSHFALKRFGVKGDSIVVFRGPMDIKNSNMADLEDLLEEKAIKSAMMLHFIVELFGGSLESAVLKQRLLVRLGAEIISKTAKVELRVEGDDIYFEDKKLSVSIAVPSPVSCLIHFGVNITNKDVPVKSASLEDFELDPFTVGSMLADAFEKEIRSIRWAVCKVRAAP